MPYGFWCQFAHISRSSRSIGLRLLLGHIKQCQCACVIWQTLIGHKHHTRIRHFVHLLWCKAKLCRILFQCLGICSVRTISRSQLTCHGASVTTIHQSLIAHNRHISNSATIVCLCHLLHFCLLLLIRLIVAVVDRLTIYSRITIGWCKVRIWIMAWCECVSRYQYIVSWYLRAICRSDTACIAVNA